MIVIEAKEDLNVLDIFGDLPGGDSIGFDRVHGYAIWGDKMSEEVHFSVVKGELIWVDKTMLAEVCKHHFDMTVVLVWVFRVNQEVINVHNQKCVLHIFRDTYHL
jgi:hypothetical protein